MAQRQPKPNQPLLDVLAVYGLAASELDDILKDGADEIERLLPKLLEKSSGKTKAAQLLLVRREVKALQSALWGELGRVVRTGVEAAATKAYDNALSVLTASLRSRGVDTTDIEAGYLQQAKAGIAAVLARSANGVPLSRAVYRSQALATGQVDRMVNRGLLLGNNAKAIAKSVEKLINPRVAGGVSYAAHRLARTEINAAYQTAQEKRYEGEPWTRGMTWNLSRSHPKTDVCNVNASQDLYGLGPGGYPLGSRPNSHPNCLCYQTPLEESEEAFIEKMVNGDYDDYLDEELGLTPKQVGEAKPQPAQDVNTAKAFDRRTAKAAKEQGALDAAPLGLERRPRPVVFTREMARAVNAYTGRWFSEINRFLRGQPTQEHDRDMIERHIENMDPAFGHSKLTREVLVYRGVVNAHTMFGDRMLGDLAGMEWREEAYVSTTALERRTRTFLGQGGNGSVLMRILVPKGTGAIEGSPFNAEAEVLLRRGLRLRVVRDNGVSPDGVRHIDVEVIRG